jgi:hypothetical protein
MMAEFNEGDYFKWTYKQHIVDKNSDSVMAGTLYWCCSGILRVVRGSLIDIFWGDNGCQDSKRWSFKEATDNLDLVFMANDKDIIKCQSPEYYSTEDIVDLRHLNNSSRDRVYMRAGAKRSLDVMISLAEHKISASEREISSAKNRLDRAKETLSKLINGEDINKIYI